MDGKFVRTMAPEKRTYRSSAMPMTEAAIDAGFLRDVYVSLGEPIERDKPEGAWGRYASTTNPSSTGSGAVAFSWPCGGPLAMPRPSLPGQGSGRGQPSRRSTKRMNKYLWILGGFVALVVLLAVGLGLNPRDVPSPWWANRPPPFPPSPGEPDQSFGPKDMAGRCGC